MSEYKGSPVIEVYKGEKFGERSKSDVKADYIKGLKSLYVKDSPARMLMQDSAGIVRLNLEWAVDECSLRVADEVIEETYRDNSKVTKSKAKKILEEIVWKTKKRS